MKKLLSALLVFVLLLSLAACGPAPSDPTETVKNPFTQGTAAPSGSDSSTQPPATSGAAEPSNSGLHGIHSGHYEFVNRIPDDACSYYDYTGGELHAYFLYEGTDDYSVCGVGPLLYLDGIPQPYKTDDEPWYSYLHVFYPEYHPDVKVGFETSQVLDVYFIPVTGEEGDALELYCTPVSNPSMDPRDPEFNNHYLVQFLAQDTPARVIFQATPPTLELPEVPDQVLSHTVTYTDEPLLQSWTPEELQSQHKYGYTINGQERPYSDSWIWPGFDQEPITLDFYIYGSSYVKYTLVCYKDYEPISIDPEDIVYVEVKDGQRTQIQVQIDMSDFDGSTPICFMTVLVPRNLQAYEDGTSAFGDHYGCRFEKINFFYFGGEEE